MCARLEGPGLPAAASTARLTGGRPCLLPAAHAALLAALSCPSTSAPSPPLPSPASPLQAKRAAWDQWSATVSWPTRTLKATKAGGGPGAGAAGLGRAPAAAGQASVDAGRAEG